MIVLEVYVTSIAARKGKGQPPILIDLQRPRTGAVTIEIMQTEVW